MKVIFGFENTLCLEKKLKQEPRAHNVSPLHLLCLGVACSPGEPPITLLQPLALWSWQIFFFFEGPGLSHISVFWSHSSQHCQNSLVKTALSVGLGARSLHSHKAPLTLESLHLIQATLLYLLSFFSSVFCQNDEWWLYRVTFHRCTEGPQVLMSHSTNISLFSLNVIPAVPHHLMRTRREGWD